MSKEKTKLDNRRSADSAALAVLDNNENCVETAFNRYLKMQPQCNFGRTGICCRICLQGPCRITKKADKGICGAHAYTIVARNLLRAITAGASAHSDHGRHIVYTVKEMLEGSAAGYAIEDPKKLRRVAERLGINAEGKNEEELLSELNGNKLPLIFHMGSCVDNSRAYDLATVLAKQWNMDMPKVPFVASAPEAMSEKAIAIGSWWVALGAPTHVGVVPEVTGSALVNGIALQIAEDVYGGYFIWEENPEKAAEKILAALDERTWKLRIHKDLAEKYETPLSSSY